MGPARPGLAGISKGAAMPRVDRLRSNGMEPERLPRVMTRPSWPPSLDRCRLAHYCDTISLAISAANSPQLPSFNPAMAGFFYALVHLAGMSWPNNRPGRLGLGLSPGRTSGSHTLPHAWEPGPRALGRDPLSYLHGYRIGPSCPGPWSASWGPIRSRAGRSSPGTRARPGPFPLTLIKPASWGI